MSTEIKADPNASRGSLDEYTVTKYTGVRKMIGENLKNSNLTAPHVYQGVEVNMEKMMAYRKKINAEYKDKGIKVSFMDIIGMCVADALKKNPANNSAIVGNEIRSYKSINIGVGADTPLGLVVPVVKDAGNMGLFEYSETAARLIQRARDGIASPEEYRDGTITLSNMGSFGLDWMTSLINAPQTSIVSITAIKERAVVIDHQICIKPTMFMVFADDHRIVDGVTNAGFINTLKANMEDPEPIVKL